MRVAVMQGRLLPPTAGRFQSFPVGSWTAEFGLAAQAGLDCLEWIYDEFGALDNPIATDVGADSMLALGAEHHVGVVSLCADYFMDRPLLRSTPAELEERFNQLEWLLRRCRRLGVERVVLPFVDASAIASADELLEAAGILARAAAFAGEIGVELHLETSLPPAPFAQLLAVLPPDVVKVNYDIGNSASLGYNPREEFGAYGERVGSVHIKDEYEAAVRCPSGRATPTSMLSSTRSAPLDTGGLRHADCTRSPWWRAGLDCRQPAAHRGMDRAVQERPS